MKGYRSLSYEMSQRSKVSGVDVHKQFFVLHFFYKNRSWHADVGDRDVPAIEVTVYMAMTQYAIWRRLK